jgi:dihydrodipicolinate synthase/N-acetylneuraminate lyase
VAANDCAKVFNNEDKVAQQRLSDINAALQDTRGGFSGLVKAGLDMLGDEGGYCRDPLPRTATADEIKNLKQTLKLVGYLS